MRLLPKNIMLSPLLKIVTALAIFGALARGVPMSPVDFKKWQCRMSLSLIYAHVSCGIKEMTMSHVAIYFCPMSHVTRPDVACRF